jgi:hypothetical protein
LTDSLTVTGVSGSPRFLCRDVGERDLEDPREAAELLIGAVLREVRGPDPDGGRIRVLDEDAAVAVLDRASGRVEAE